MSSPAKKKSKKEAKGAAKVCDYTPRGRKKCEKPVATSRPQEANATLNSNRCAGHQPCKNSGCQRIVGQQATFQKSGLCSKCNSVQSAVEKQEEKKQTIQNIVQNKNNKLPARTVAGASFLAAAYNDDQNKLSPPTALKDIDRDITTDDVLENQLYSLESVPEVEIKSDSNNKKKKAFSLDGVKVYLLNGDDEDYPGTLRTVIEDGAVGQCTLEGIDKRSPAGSSLFCVMI